VLYCTIRIITLGPARFLYKNATSNQLTHTVTLVTAGSHHKSNYLRCYCFTVSFKIDKPYSESAHTLPFQQLFTTRLQAQFRCYCAVLPAQYNVTDKPHLIATHPVGPNHIRPPTFHTRHGPRTPEDDDITFRCSVTRSPPPRRSVVSPNSGLWVAAPCQHEN